MTRLPCAALFVLMVALADAPARGELPVAPAPREVRPDGSRDAVPPPEPPAKGENPAVTVERIIKNSRDVGDKLAKTDTGTDTRKTQGKILSDIDALIDRQENPPPPQPDKNPDKSDQKDNQDKKDDKPDQKNDQKGKSDQKDQKKDMGAGTPMKGDMPMDKDGMGDPMPKGGTGDQPPMARKPRAGEPKGDDGKEPGPKPKDHPGKPDDKQAGGKESKTGKDPADPKAGTAGKAGGTPDGKGGKPALPFEEEDASKDVWGHLPDKLRQQMSQYYKDEFTPKYAELLKLYYSSLADKNARPGMPKK